VITRRELLRQLARLTTFAIAPSSVIESTAQNVRRADADQQQIDSLIEVGEMFKREFDAHLLDWDDYHFYNTVGGVKYHTIYVTQIMWNQDRTKIERIHFRASAEPKGANIVVPERSIFRAGHECLI